MDRQPGKSVEDKARIVLSVLDSVDHHHHLVLQDFIDDAVVAAAGRS